MQYLQCGTFDIQDTPIIPNRHSGKRHINVKRSRIVVLVLSRQIWRRLQWQLAQWTNETEFLSSLTSLDDDKLDMLIVFTRNKSKSSHLQLSTRTPRDQPTRIKFSIRGDYRVSILLIDDAFSTEANQCPSVRSFGL